MKAAKFSKQKCYFQTFFCPTDNLVAHFGTTVKESLKRKKKFITLVR